MTTARGVELCAGDLRVSVDPAMGAAIRAFDLADPVGRLPVLAAACPAPQDAGQSALFPMAPFANRARGNRLTIAGRDTELPPNTGDLLCLHGWAWQRAWHVEALSPGRCRLRLELRECGYDLNLTYEMRLSPNALQLELRAANQSAERTPVGLGLHPYFPRCPDTEIRFAATTVWSDGPDHLPKGAAPISSTDDYSAGRSLPHTWRNECYSGWTGTARIRQPDLGYDLELRASGTESLMFYADPALPRFALEPQSHVSGETHTGADGLTVLAPGEEKRVGLSISVQSLVPGAPR